MFTDTFPPSIYPALLILAVVFLRIRTFVRRRDYMQLGRALPELILGIIYFIDFIRPFATTDRVNLIRNTIILIFATELFYQVYILPKMRRMNDGSR
jgi:hypothetical protein